MLQDPGRYVTIGVNDVGRRFTPDYLVVVNRLTGGHLPGAMRLTFLISLIALALLYATLWKYEMAAKNARMQTRALRRLVFGDDEIRPLKRSAAPS